MLYLYVYTFNGQCTLYYIEIQLHCSSSTEYIVYLSTPNRCLRQEDPLSLFLFIISVQIFTRLLNKKKNLGNSNIKINRGTLAISHLLDADDILISCRANKDKVATVMKALNCYRAWSGQEPNKEKSNILFSKNLSGH